MPAKVYQQKIDFGVLKLLLFAAYGKEFESIMTDVATYGPNGVVVYLKSLEPDWEIANAIIKNFDFHFWGRHKQTTEALKAGLNQAYVRLVGETQLELAELQSILASLVAMTLEDYEEKRPPRNNGENGPRIMDLRRVDDNVYFHSDDIKIGEELIAFTDWRVSQNIYGNSEVVEVSFEFPIARNARELQVIKIDAVGDYSNFTSVKL